MPERVRKRCPGADEVLRLIRYNAGDVRPLPALACFAHSGAEPAARNRTATSGDCAPGMRCSDAGYPVFVRRNACAPALPAPIRTRWQPLRPGLLELFHYDSEELGSAIVACFTRR